MTDGRGEGQVKTRKAESWQDKRKVKRASRKPGNKKKTGRKGMGKGNKEKVSLIITATKQPTRRSPNRNSLLPLHLYPSSSYSSSTSMRSHHASNPYTPETSRPQPRIDWPDNSPPTSPPRKTNRQHPSSNIENEGRRDHYALPTPRTLTPAPPPFPLPNPSPAPPTRAAAARISAAAVVLTLSRL